MAGKWNMKLSSANSFYCLWNGFISWMQENHIEGAHLEETLRSEMLVIQSA